MSTKSSVYYSIKENLHIYEECYERNTLYVDGIRLSLAAAQTIGRWANSTIRNLRECAAMTDEKIRQRVEKAVDERIEYAKEASGKPRGHAAHFMAMGGCMVYGDANDPRDEQIKRGVQRWQVERTIAVSELERLKRGDEWDTDEAAPAAESE